MKKVLIVLAEGFEETEAIVPIDILRRAGIDAVIAGADEIAVEGAHGITIKADTLLKDCKGIPDAVIFPGGMPGAENLAASKEVNDLIDKMFRAKKIIAAICASPALVLAPTGVLSGKKATCYPKFEGNFPQDVEYVNKKVVRSDNIITSQGPGTAAAFGLEIVEVLSGQTKRNAVAAQMLLI